MLVLYKQYLQNSDINSIEYYSSICNILNEKPIIFTDKIISVIQNIESIPIFSTLYLTKINQINLIVILFDNNDCKIINNIGIANENIIIVNNLNINDTVSQIRSKRDYHE